MDCSAIVLNKLLLERNLDLWAKLKLGYLDSAYSSTYSAVSRYYDKYGQIPSFEELEIVTRDTITAKTVSLLKLIDEPDISSEVALDALLDQYTQNEAISMLDKFVDKLPIYDSAEIKENLSNIVLRLDEKTLTTEGVYTMSDIMLFKSDSDISRERTYLGLNNTFDATLNGVALEELILVGGPKGSGKSITSSNIVCNQYEAGNSCVFFTIEMVAHEVHERNFAILSDVPYLQLKQGTLSAEDMYKVVKTRANMFDDAQDLIEEYVVTRDRFKFESRLVREKTLKKDNQIIIIDDRALTLTSIDLHLGKLKARFGDKLKVCVVDYLNQIVMEGASQFDWQPQIIISKKLKELARKHKVVMFSPYQIDSTGEARFAKGILDAADIALRMKTYDKEKGAMGFETAKIRGGPPMNFTSPINWDTLRISSVPMEAPEAPTERKDNIKRAGKSSNKSEESAQDLTPPW